MKKLKWQPPYDKNGKTNFRAAKNRTGVYLIRENGKIVYIGNSGYDLYKTMYRHFQWWQHHAQTVISYQSRLKKKKYTVRIVYCTPKQARYLERALIVKHKPRDNSVKYALYNQDYTKAEIKYEQNVIDTYEELEVSPDYNYGLPF